MSPRRQCWIILKDRCGYCLLVYSCLKQYPSLILLLLWFMSYAGNISEIQDFLWWDSQWSLSGKCYCCVNVLVNVAWMFGWLLLWYVNPDSSLSQALSVQQLYRICTQYWDDKYNTKSVSSTVSSISKLYLLLNVKKLQMLQPTLLWLLKTASWYLFIMEKKSIPKLLFYESFK